MTRDRPLPRRLAAAAAFALAALLLAPAVAVATDRSTLADYRRRVDAAYATVAAAPDAWREEIPAQDLAARLNTFLPATERVQVGTLAVDVDNSVLRSLIARLDVSKIPAERHDTEQSIERHLGSLKLAVDEVVTSVRSDRALLTTLLARADLSAKPSLEDAIAAFLARLTKALQEWFARVTRQKGVATASDIALGVVLTGLALLLIATVVYVIRGLSASLASHDERVMAERAADAAVVAAAEDLPPDALAYADGLAGVGRFRDATRALFGGAARTLVELGLLRMTRTRTNAELLADLGPAAPPVLQPMTALSSRFERAWYGHADPGQAGYAETRERYAASLAAAERSAAEKRAPASAEDGDAT
jgi:hypothetical protein